MMIMQFVLCLFCFHCCLILLLLFLPDVSRHLSGVILISAPVSTNPCSDGAFSRLMIAPGAGSDAGCGLLL